MRVNVYSLILTITLIMVSITPLILCAIEYNWDIHRILSPVFKPPKIDFSIRFKGLGFENGNIMIYLTLRNRGEVPLNITGLEGEILVLGSVVLGNISIPKPVYVDVGESRELKLLLNLRREALIEIVKSILGGSIELKAEVKAIVEVEIYGVKARVPLKYEFELPLHLGL
ncbi:MAG TPA: hypothetical protein EYH40_05685 [Desulfurococcales archaeon]|nr:hypothetical protein [Desulfurococcales archaeon]